MSRPPLLLVESLTVEVARPGGWTPVVEDLNLELGHGESVGLVGESGTGKSVTLLALCGLLPPGLRVAPGSRIRWRGQDLTATQGDPWRELRGSAMGVMFQDPGRSLDPLFGVGDQVEEVVAAHSDVTGDEARRQAARLLERVGLAEGGDRYGAYPHELSGGELQRVALAAALAGEPDLLLADEPTSSLDAPVAAGVLGLMDELRRERETALLVVSHDLGAVGRVAGRVAVLYAGRIVEEGPVSEVLGDPSHPYTRALLASLPPRSLEDTDESGASLEAIPGRVPAPGGRPGGCRFRPRCPHAWDQCLDEPPLLDAGRSRARCWLVEKERAGAASAGGAAGGSACSVDAAQEPGATTTGTGATETMLEARGLTRRYGAHLGVEELDLAISPGDSVGLVGRSGSGKSTAARLLLRLERPDAGELRFRGRDAWSLDRSGLLEFRRLVQPVFQHPTASLNPRLTVGAAVQEPLEVHGLARGAEARDRATAALERVGLDPGVAARHPHELSGGECQRAALARALILGPRILVADEATSSLDVSVQAAILNLLVELREELGLGLLLISHDLPVVRHVCRRIAVMYAGRVVERGTTERIFRCPEDEHTRELVDGAFAPAGST